MAIVPAIALVPLQPLPACIQNNSRYNYVHLEGPLVERCATV